MNSIFKVNDSKLKSIYISYNFTFKIDKKEVPKSVITSLVLSKGCKKYKTTKEIEEYLSWAYGTMFDINTEKIGDLYNIEFRIECLNKKFIPNNEDVVYKAIEFLYELIYNPKIEGKQFDKEIFVREKELLIQKIEKRKDEKLKYALQRAEELLCEDEPYGVFVYGNKEDAEKIVLDDIYEKYIDIINNSNVSVIVSGNLEGYEDISENISKIFEGKINKNIDLKEMINKNNKIINETIEIKELMPTNQSVIALGMKVENSKINDFYVLNVYNNILGGNPSSKLFQNVREKESLAYAIRSRYYRFKNIIVIFAGIDESSYDKAKEVIIKQIEDMENGKISEIEINSAKESLVNDMLEWKDSKTSLAKLIFTNNIYNQNLTVDDIINNIKSIEVKDVIDISKRIKIELIYLLGGANIEE